MSQWILYNDGLDWMAQIFVSQFPLLHSGHPWHKCINPSLMDDREFTRLTWTLYQPPIIIGIDGTSGQRISWLPRASSPIIHH